MICMTSKTSWPQLFHGFSAHARSVRCRRNQCPRAKRAPVLFLSSEVPKDDVGQACQTKTHPHNKRVRGATAAQTNARSGTHPITSPANRSDQKSREASECLWEKDVHSSSSIPTTGFYPFCCAMTHQTSRYISMISLVDI